MKTSTPEPIALITQGALRGVTAKILADYGTYLTILGGPGVLVVSEDYIERLPVRHLSPASPSESLVTAGRRAGPGGIPAATPSAPCSERQEVPTLADCTLVNLDRDPLATARLGQATLTTG